MRRQTRYILALALTIGALLLPGLARVIPLLAASTPTTATFVRMDTTTRGTWQGVYGADGYNVIGDTASNPSYATPSVSGASFHPLCDSDSTCDGDADALQKAPPNTAHRIAAVWYSSGSFTIDINVTDGQTHRVAIYCVDGYGGGRTQTVQILDGAGAPLDKPRTLSNFASKSYGGPGGIYLAWNISGHVKIQVTNANSSPNAVVSGLFFDPAQPIYSSPQADPTNNNALICPSPDQSVAQGVSVPGAYAYGQTVAENNPFDPMHASSTACQPGGSSATNYLNWGSQPITSTPPTAAWIASDKAYQTYNLCYKNCGQPNYRPYNGRWVTIYTKIPDDYTTTYNPVDAGGHPLNPNPGWWYVQYNTTSHQSFTDRTTWEMTILTRGPHLVQ